MKPEKTTHGTKLTKGRVFNTGSAINVRAGHYSNIDHVIEHYKEQNRKQAEKTRARLERGEQIG